MAENFHRREFLKALTVASSGALAACSASQPQKLIPYVVPPEGTIPGVPVWYKSVCRECPAGCGTLVRTREGRVVKVEGNPEHPVNRGALCARGQAAVEGLYNPDRIAQPLRRNDDGRLEAITWEQAEELLVNTLRYLRYARRAGRVALLTERVTGSTQRFFRDWLAAVGSQNFLIYEPFAYEALRAANRITFGAPEIPHYDLSRAGMLLSLGADFLETWVSNVQYTRQFAEFRRPRPGAADRFVSVGPRLSLTSANADEWIPIRPGGEMILALGLVHEILAANLARLPAGEVARLSALGGPFTAKHVERETGLSSAHVARLAREFAAAQPGLALGPGVTASGLSATATEAAVNLLNYVCGNIGQSVQFGRGADWESVATHRQMLDFVEKMRGDEFDVVIFCRVNPAYALPEVSGFARALGRVPFKISFSSLLDETAAQCDLILPDAAPLERWEEFSPCPGVYGLAQPAMAPGFHFQSRQAEDVLLSVSRKTDADFTRRLPAENFRDYLREEWKALHREFGPGKDFETFWRGAVEAGGVWREVPIKEVRLNEAVLKLDFAAAAESASARPPVNVSGPTHDLSLVVYPSAQFFDGRGASRPWLQETPDAMTKIVWDSWAEIHPATAQKKGIGEGDLVKLTSANGTIQLPAHLYDGAREDIVAIPLGQGHTSFGRWGEGHGSSPLRLLPAATEAASGGLLWAGTTVRIERLAVNRALARTQVEDSQHDREIAQIVPLSALLANKPQEPKRHEALSLYAPHPHPEHRWGMAIDLNACVGCNACVVACAVENSVPWMGKEQVSRGRHMAWMRMDRYFEPVKGGGVEARFVPMLCQQCDNAPCESVCPVYATYHNIEGLNVQVYNRCVGTRYCSNNCPYKVRRFNWFDHDWPWPMALGLNPDLSARSKGVMEKCTFCIQRIRAAKDTAKDEKRGVRDGEITPACAQTCPAGAIVFGDLNDAKSRVSVLARGPRAYHVLDELNTRPAVTYLKKISRREEA